jgi:transposase
MARRKVAMNEIVEIIYHWHQGSTIKGIQRSLKFARKTIRKYIRMAQQVGVRREESFPDEQELIKGLRRLSRSPSLYETPAIDAIAPYRDRITQWLESEHITAKQIWRLLREEYALSVGYSTVKRYLKREFAVGTPPITVRIETPAGQQAQVDFGYAGLMYDPVSKRQRRAWAFIMSLSYSRHRFVRFVFRMDSPTWIDCHLRAFEFFGGVPATIVLDNLKPGVIKADIYDPTLNRAYADLERHYSFVADPAKVGSPKLKGKVERVVPVVRQHLLAGRFFRDITEANQRALLWSRNEIGQQIHGTTKRRPYPVFLQEEKPTLTPLPAEPFEIPLWKECSVHPDHHVVFDRSYYSLPTRYIGKKVWVRGTHKLVRIFFHHELIKTHRRARYPGEWVTDLSDYPPEKLAYLMATPSFCRAKAAEYGPFTEKLIHTILSEHAMRNLRKAQGILRLAEKYGAKEMERACERALKFGNYRYKSLTTILERGVSPPEDAPPAPPALSSLGERFLRPATYFTQEVHP